MVVIVLLTEFFHSSTTDGTLHIKSPDPETYFKNRDHAHTFRGFCYGIIVILASFISIGWFITWTLSGKNLVTIAYTFQ